MCSSRTWIALCLAFCANGCALIFPQTSQRIAVPLPFIPTAINDAGVIVGNDPNGGPVSYQGGTVTNLPPESGVQGPFNAVDIASNGAILGSTGDPNFPGTFWLSGGIQLPMNAAPVGFFVPKAINVHVAVAGSAFDAQRAYKWTPNASGYTELLKPGNLPPGNYDTRATDINDAGATVGFAIAIPSGPTHIIVWSPDATPTELDVATGFFGNPHILNDGEVFWMNEGSIIRNFNGTSTFQQPPQVESFDAVSQVGRLAGTKKVNGVTQGFTFFQGVLTFLELPNVPAGHHFRPVDVNSCGDIVGIHVGPSGETLGGILFVRSQIIATCDTPPVLTQ